MDVKMHPEIEKALTDKGEAWCIAAMVEGSIGYHDPYDAKRMIERYRGGERQNFCERCYCLYGSDLEKMLLDDVRKFQYFEENCPESFEHVMKFIDAWSKRPEEPFGGLTGLMYPTIV